MKVQVKPIEKHKWHGKTGGESFQNTFTIQAVPDPQTQKYKTGLTEEDREFLKERGVVYNLSEDYLPGEIHPFWDTKVGFVELKNATKIYDTNNPLERIHVAIMKASKYVANSQREFDEGLFPDATHVIFSEAEENEILASKIELEAKAIRMSVDVSSARKAEIILITEGKNFKGKDQNTIEVEFYKALKKDPKLVIAQIENSPEKTTLYALVLEALQKSVLRRSPQGIKFMEITLGFEPIDVVDFLTDDENQEVKLKLMNLLNN